MAKSLEELAMVLRRPLVEVDISFAPLAPRVEEVISRILRQSPPSIDEPFTSYIGPISYAAVDVGRWQPLLAYCNESSALAQAGRTQDPLAVWGGTCGSLAAVYHRNHKPALWHETAHLLGADDCYDKSNPHAPATCELGNRCIMQWQADEKTISAWPFLCKNNVACIRERVRPSGKKDNGET